MTRKRAISARCEAGQLYFNVPIPPTCRRRSARFAPAAATALTVLDDARGAELLRSYPGVVAEVRRTQ